MTLTEGKYRLISADDHVDLSHEQIKANLSTKFHDDYDAAVGEFIQSMMGLLSASANNLWREQNGEDVADGQLRGLGTGNHWRTWTLTADGRTRCSRYAVRRWDNCFLPVGG
jgi:hypothetical protein